MKSTIGAINVHFERDVESHLENILNKSIDIYSRVIHNRKLFFLPFLLLMLGSLLLTLFPYGPVFAGANFLRFDLYPETSFVLFVGILFALICMFSYCMTLLMAATSSYLQRGRLEFAVHDPVGKFLSILGSYFILFVTASTMSLVIVWIQALDFGILTFFVKLTILLIWFGIFLIFWFTPQAIVVDDRSLASAMSASTKFMKLDFHFIMTFLFFATIIMGVLYILGSIHISLSIIVYVINFMVLLPLLIIIQTVIYLTRYTLRRISVEE